MRLSLDAALSVLRGWTLRTLRSPTRLALDGTGRHWTALDSTANRRAASSLAVSNSAQSVVMYLVMYPSCALYLVMYTSCVMLCTVSCVLCCATGRLGNTARRFVLSFRVAGVRCSAQHSSAPRLHGSTAHEDPTSGGVGARQCGVRAESNRSAVSCPWPQRHSILRRRHAHSAADDESPNLTVCYDPPTHCTVSTQHTCSANIPSRPSAAERVSRTSLASHLRRAGVAEGGRVWSAPVPGGTQAYRNLAAQRRVWRRCAALGCPAQASHLELSRTARAPPSSLAAGPLSNLRRG